MTAAAPVLLTEQSQIADASTADLVYTYNQLAGKEIKKFSSRAAGETAVANAILGAKNRAGKAGVAKGEKPVAKPLDKAAAKAEAAAAKAEEKRIADEAKAKDKAKADAKKQKEADAAAKLKAKQQAEADRVKLKEAKANERAEQVKARQQAAAKKVAERASGTKSTVGRTPTYNMVRLTEPSTPRRPNPNSMRTKVLEALKVRGVATITQLSDDVGFNARGYVHKLVLQEWAEVTNEAAETERAAKAKAKAK